MELKPRLWREGFGYPISTVTGIPNVGELAESGPVPPVSLGERGGRILQFGLFG